MRWALPADATLPGASLLDVIAAGRGADRPVVLRGDDGEPRLAAGRRCAASSPGGDKYIDLPIPELYDLGADPGSSGTCSPRAATAVKCCPTRSKSFNVAPPGRPTCETVRRHRADAVARLHRPAPRRSASATPTTTIRSGSSISSRRCTRRRRRSKGGRRGRSRSLQERDRPAAGHGGRVPVSRVRLLAGRTTRRSPSRRSRTRSSAASRSPTPDQARRVSVADRPGCARDHSCSKAPRATIRTRSSRWASPMARPAGRRDAMSTFKHVLDIDPTSGLALPEHRDAAGDAPAITRAAEASLRQALAIDPKLPGRLHDARRGALADRPAGRSHRGLEAGGGARPHGVRRALQPDARAGAGGPRRRSPHVRPRSTSTQPRRRCSSRRSPIVRRFLDGGKIMNRVHGAECWVRGARAGACARCDVRALPCCSLAPRLARAGAEATLPATPI